ncbi:ureidoglycolate lyase [Oceanibaculum pacificum]|uniref:Ureidoglycolate hydrolase n=1 Tax=Oceanibaculum pacificum TaxID=580166 RepID=A0A154WGB9_9PROT|nr:ureidoglycolate lyase [Oceanibaculum pacificum]KZD12573.1 hypothetical protein AUP43_04250 [Oceanibaculum pacificum]
MTLIAAPLTEAAFAPFGRVVEAPAKAGRAYFGPLIENSRPSASLDFSLTHTAASALPFEARVMERHPLTAQAFLALDVSRFLVIVAPGSASAGGEEGPDMTRARAFIGRQGQALVYAPAVWHHGMIALDHPGRFSILMWCAPDGRDDEFVTLETPVTVGA